MAIVTKTIKDIANNGYKIKVERLEEIGENINSSKRLAILFVPIINIVEAIQIAIQYQNQQNWILDMFNTTGIIEEMEEEEKEIYQIHPTFINAIVISIESESKVKSRETLKLENSQGKIFYIKGENEEDIKIYGKVGTAQELTEEESKEKVIEYLKKEKEQMKQKFDLVLDCDEFLELVDQIEETDGIKRQQKLMDLYEQKKMLETEKTFHNNEIEKNKQLTIKK